MAILKNIHREVLFLQHRDFRDFWVFQKIATHRNFGRFRLFFEKK